MRTLIILLSLALAVAASADPVITSVTPNTGPVGGGTKLIIKGTGFSNNCIICSPPFADPEVRFYTTPAASVKFIDDKTLEVVTPAHMPATVSISVRNLDGTNEAHLPNAFEFTGDPNEAFDPILFPIFLPPVHGAFGSEFHTFARIWNEDPFESTLVYGRDTACYLFSPHLDALIPLELQNNGIDQVLLTGCSESTGRIFWAPKTARGKDTIAASLRVTDVTRQAASHGVEIPVVHRNDLREGRISLLGVPIDPKFRNTLRIYSLARGTQRISLSVNGEGHQIELQPGASWFEPGYAEFTDFPLPAELPAGQDTIRVVVDAIPPCPICPLPHVVPPIWAFITVTNNETQHITTITPN